jgi:negative regulator of flagellin synthesis FlgM
MKVDTTANPGVQGSRAEGLNKSEQTSKSDRPQRASPTAKEAGTTASAQSEISSRGKDFAKAHAVASSASDIRADKIAELKKRIAGGEYKIDSEAVADKMIKEHMSF